MKQVLLVFLGGGLGSMFRYVINRFIVTKQLNPLWATLSVNVLGSLLIGLILGWAMRSTNLSQNTVLFLATGLCGGFTTFSTFAYENQQLIKAGDFITLFIYGISSFALGIAAVFLGLWLSKT